MSDLPQFLDETDLPTTFKYFPDWLAKQLRHKRLSPLTMGALIDIIQSELRAEMIPCTDTEASRCAHFARLALQLINGKHTKGSLANSIGGVPGLPAVIARRHRIAVPNPEARASYREERGAPPATRMPYQPSTSRRLNGEQTDQGVQLTEATIN